MPKLTIYQASLKLGRSHSSIRKDVLEGRIPSERVPGPGGFKYLIDFPDEAEPAPGQALASDTEALAWGTETLASRELIDQLKADLANATDRITFLEGHISQLTHALGPGQEPEAAAGQAPKPESTHKSLLEHVRDWYWRR